MEKAYFHNCVWIFTVTFLLGISFHGAESECPPFPDFVQNNVTDPGDFWIYHKTIQDGLSSAVRVTSEDIFVKGLQWGVAGEVSVNATCVDKENDIYIVQISANDGKICLRFDNTTENVILLEAAQYDNSTSKCGDLKSHRWPLIANKPRTQEWKFCPVIGGFDFTATQMTATEDKELCQGNPVPPSFYIECVKGEGLLLDFPDVACIPDKTGWSQKQTLYCLDYWDDSTYEYSILGVEHFKPEWCMRLPKDREGNFTAHIFQDLICPNSEKLPNVTYIELKMSPKESVLLEPGCTFEDSMTTVQHTRWGQSNIQIPNSIIDIMNSSLNIQEFANFTCHEKVDKDTYALHADVGQGCPQRYSCVKFQRQSPAILSYKLSQSQDSYTNKLDLCAEQNFQDDPSPLADRYRSRFMKALVANDENLMAPKDCVLEGFYNLELTVHSETCSGTLTDFQNCTQQNFINLNATCTTGNYIRDITCLGDFYFSSVKNRFMITKNEKDGMYFPVCWIFPDLDNDPMTFYVTSSSDCNQGTIFNYKAGLNLYAVDGVLTREDVCSFNETTSTPAPNNDTTIASTTEEKTTEEASSTESNSTGSNPTGTTPQTSTSTSAPVGGMSAGSIAGIVIGVLLIAGLLGFLAYWTFKNRENLFKRAPYRVL